MQRLRESLENLDEALSDLEDRIGLDRTRQSAFAKKQAEILKVSRAREAGALAVAQKVAARLDQTIASVEHIIRH